MSLPNPDLERHLRGGPPYGRPAGPVDGVLRPLLHRAGAAAWSLQGRVGADRKSDGSPVTEADRRAEHILVEGLKQAFPRDEIRSEEGGGAAGTQVDGAVWWVDPVDGTSAFTEGLPHWGPTVARTVDGRVTAAALWLPVLSQYWYVDEVSGAFQDGAPMLPLGDPAPLPHHVVYVPSRMHTGPRLTWPGKARCLGSIAAHLALVASGSALAALVPPGWEPWDTACGLALIQALGGRVVGADGRPVHMGSPQGGASMRDLPRAPFAAGTPSALASLFSPLPNRPA